MFNLNVNSENIIYPYKFKYDRLIEINFDTEMLRKIKTLIS